MCVSLIAAVLRTVSGRTLCHYVMPWSLELASPDPALRRSGSPPLSLARDQRGQRKIKMEEKERAS